MSSKQLKAVLYFFLPLAVLWVAAHGAYGWPWSRDMYDQPSIRTHESPRVSPANSIPRWGKEQRMDRVKAGKTLRNPLEPTPGVITRGQQLYEVYCSLCHGNDGRGGGPIAGRFVPPPDLTLEVFRKRPDGFIYETIRAGGPIMPAQGEALTPKERWEIVTYLRSLQQKANR